MASLSLKTYEGSDRENDSGCKVSPQSTVGQITIFLDINRTRHKMVKNAIKV